MALPVFSYPNSARLEEIAQDFMPHLMQDDPLFDFFPVSTQDEDMMMWEQLDNFVGLQQVRGLNGQPPKVQPVGISRFETPPGAYGEWQPIDELQLTKRRKQATFGTPIDISDLVMQKEDQNLQRRLDRYRWLAWTLFATGTFSVTGPTGAVLHTDSYSFQKFTAAVHWNVFATSTPLADFSTIQLLSRGHSVDFGARALAFMNRQTFNDLRQNVNSVDLYGRRTAGLGTFNNQASINALLQGDDLPSIVIYDRHYLDDTGAIQMFIPYQTVIIVGVRPAGQTVGQMRHVRNVNNPDMTPGPYIRVIDKRQFEVPGTLEVHDGWNGGPIVWYPSAVVVMSV
jgi:Phage major capsid protein E